MKKITAIIITKNEENMIADCIDSVSFCDEVLVIDSASTDNTVAIAKHIGAKTYVIDDTVFSQAKRRNFGKEKAKSKWVFYIDADERVSKDLETDIKKVIEEKNPKYSVYRVERKNYYLGNHEWPVTEKLERLFKKDALEGWFGDLHESPKVTGTIGDLSGFLKHYTHKDLSSMLAKTIAWSEIEAKLRMDANHPQMTWWRFPRVMSTAFYDSYIKQKGYTVGVVGLIESMYQAFSMFITYAKLWELQVNERKN